MKTFKKSCKTCGKEFLAARNKQYCCVECRPKKKRYYNRSHDNLGNLAEVSKEAHKKGLTYGQYVAQQYISERMNKNNE